MAVLTAQHLAGLETQPLIRRVDYVEETGGSASLTLMPDMTDRRINEIFRGKLVDQFDGLPVAELTDRQKDARRKVVASTAQELSSGTLQPDTREAQVVRAAIEHQLKADGASAADSLAEDVTKLLPNGMKLTIEPDDAFEQRVREFCAEHGLPVPTYIRVVQLSDRNGLLLGQIGITGDANAHKKN